MSAQVFNDKVLTYTGVYGPVHSSVGLSVTHMFDDASDARVGHLLSCKKKNLPARLHVYHRLESTNHQKIGEIIKAL